MAAAIHGRPSPPGGCCGLRLQWRCQSRMTPLQRYSLSPYSKWRHFGQWPWQLTWHLCLIALSTYQVVVYNAVEGVSRRALGMHFAKAFYPDDYASYNGDDAVHPWKHYYIYNWPDLVGDMSLALQRYYSLHNTGLAHTGTTAPTLLPNSSLPWGVLEGGAEGGGLPAPRLQIETFDQDAGTLWSRASTFDPHATHTHTFSLVHPAAAVGPLLEGLAGSGPAPHSAFMARLRTMTLTLTMDAASTQDAAVAWTYTGCVRWAVHLKYHFHAKGQVEVLPGYHLHGACAGGSLNKTHPLGVGEPDATPAPPPVQAPAPTPPRQQALPSRVSVPPPAPKHRAPPQALPPQSSGGRAVLTGVAVLTLLVAVAHEVTLLSECVSAVSLVSGLLDREEEAAGTGAPATRRTTRESLGALSFDSDEEGDVPGIPVSREVRLLRTLASVHDSDAQSCWDVSWRQRCLVVRGWMVVASLGNIASTGFLLLTLARFHTDKVLPGAGLVLPPSPADGILPRMLLGTGSALLWLSLLQYLEYVPKYYAFVLTLQRAVPRILRFLTSVLPLFLAWGVFGLVMFGAFAPRWASAPMTLITLFAVVNGDAMKETFDHTRIDGNGWMIALSQVFLYTFFALFNYVVLMVLIAINEEAFFASRPNAVIDVFDGRQLPIMLRSILEQLPEDARASSNRRKED